MRPGSKICKYNRNATQETSNHPQGGGRKGCGHSAPERPAASQGDGGEQVAGRDSEAHSRPKHAAGVGQIARSQLEALTAGCSGLEQDE